MWQEPLGIMWKLSWPRTRAWPQATASYLTCTLSYYSLLHTSFYGLVTNIVPTDTIIFL